MTIRAILVGPPSEPMPLPPEPQRKPRHYLFSEDRKTTAYSIPLNRTRYRHKSDRSPNLNDPFAQPL